MPFKPGQSGNPGGRATERAYQNALRAAVNAECPKEKRRKLVLIAEKAASLAVKGEPWAINHVAERLDGKAAQESTVTVRSELDGMDEAGLRAFIQREMAQREDEASVTH